MENEYTRREFLALTAASAAGSFLIGCAGPPDVYVPPLLDQAPDGPELQAALVGCGGRGTGAAMNFLDAGPNLRLTALGDVFQDRLEGCRQRLKEQRDVEIADDHCFVGFDAYQRVLDTDVDLVMFATPPHFRPLHFAAAVAAGKHVFLEKPLAVDPVGARSVMVTAKKAKNLGLNVATGTQYRHQRDFVATYQQVMAGAIGEIEAAYAYYDTGQLWYRESRPDWSEMEYMIRDWVNWRWLSGDHIVEQFIHNLDTMYWFLGAHPVKAVGYGGRARRVTGDQFDFFSVEYVYDSGLHLSAMCRQINGTVHDVSNRLVGTNGITNVRNTIQRPDGKTVWQYQYPEEVKEVPWGAGTGQVAVSPYVQEHIDAVTNIRNNTPLVEAENTAISTMMAIMGREAAYTGQAVTWEDMMSSQLRLGPEEYAWGPVDIDKNVPVPGTA